MPNNWSPFKYTLRTITPGENTESTTLLPFVCRLVGTYLPTNLGLFV